MVIIRERAVHLVNRMFVLIIICLLVSRQSIGSDYACSLLLLTFSVLYHETGGDAV